MKSAPSIYFDEFAKHTTFSDDHDNGKLTVLNHPEFGKWESNTIDLKYFKVTEHRTDLNRELNVVVDDDTLMEQVNHCMCVDGSLGAHFGQHNLKAYLNPGSYHYITVQADEYVLAMSKRFHNIHIQVSREYYAQLLADDEAWSAKLKESIYSSDVCYPGEFSLTPGMFKTISDIFSSPLTGSLKKLMTEAKVLELVALQLNTSLTAEKGKKVNKNKNVLFDVREYLEQSFLEEHSLKSICQMFGINEFVLKNGFREKFETTVFEFILTRRLEHARHLLQEGVLSIQEVSSMVGYKYPNHFSTAFKKKFGVSPGKVHC